MSEYIVFTSSGGGGHKVAAKMYAEKKESKDSSNRIHEIDVMQSGCSFGSVVGKALTNLWDDAQHEGDVDRQRKLFQLQPLAEKIFFVSTFVTTLYYLLRSKTPPKRVVCFQPLHLLAITSAIRAANLLKFRQKPIQKIDLYFTDMPTEKAEHYLNALKRLKQASETAFNMIRVMAPDPVDENGEVSKTFWSRYNVTHIKKKSLPLCSAFRKPELMPLPGTEQTFNLANGESYSIHAKDKVAFIMLGSNPEKNAILKYIDSYIDAASKADFKEDSPMHYLYVSCGKGVNNELLKAVQRKISESKLDSHIKIIPFENQPISQIFARSDLSITRSGGMTSSEILALKSRPQDTKRVIIHSPLTETIVGNEEAVKRMLLSRIPLWENGNAEQLMWHSHVKAEVANPRLSQSIFANFFT